MEDYGNGTPNPQLYPSNPLVYVSLGSWRREQKKKRDCLGKIVLCIYKIYKQKTDKVSSKYYRPRNRQSKRGLDMNDVSSTSHLQTT